MPSGTPHSLPNMRGMSTRKAWKRRLGRVDVTLALLVAVVVALVLGRYTPEEAYSEWSETSIQSPIAEPVQVPGSMEHLDTKSMPRSGPMVRFLMFNVRNYFVAEEQSRSPYVIYPKSEKSRQAVAEVLASVAPDVVGLIEVGGERALEDIRQRLSRLGHVYPHSRILLRKNEPRALALLSKYPIVQDMSQVDYGLYGQQRRHMLRGILDVVIRPEDGRLFRVVGVHLKSRVAENAQAARSLRTREAQTLALYLQQTMRRQSGLPVLVFGDWNDGPADDSLAVLTQGISKDAALKRLNPCDTAGHEWTLYFKEGHEYHTFDQIYVNAVLGVRRGRSCECGIVDIPASRQASDHRAVWCDMR